MSFDIDHLAHELAPHGARGGLGVALARLVEQLADVGVRSRVFVPAGVLAQFTTYRWQIKVHTSFGWSEYGEFWDIKIQ